MQYLRWDGSRQNKASRDTAIVLLSTKNKWKMFYDIRLLTTQWQTNVIWHTTETTNMYTSTGCSCHQGHRLDKNKQKTGPPDKTIYGFQWGKVGNPDHI